MQQSAERPTLIAAVLASSMAFIDGSALNVALPSLQTDLGASGEQLLWIVNGYLLMLAALILPGGALGDRLGRKRVYMVGIVIFLVASVACGLAPSAPLLIAARVAQGIGGALMIPGSLALIAAVFAPARRGQAIGTWSSVTTLVTLGGPLLGGLLADAGLWRLVFLINIPLGLLALAILATRVPESRAGQTDGGIDYVGAALVAGGLATLTYGCLAAPERGLGDALVLASIVGGLVLLVAFVLYERRVAHPMLPVQLFASRGFSAANAYTLLLYGALSAGTLFLPLNLVQVQGYTQTAAGLAFLPFTLLLALLARRMGALADARGPRLPLALGALLVGVGFALLALPGLTGGPDTYWITYFPGIVALGLGMALVVAPLTASVMAAAPPEATGAASGVNNAISRAAGVLATAIIGGLALGLFAQVLAARTTGLTLDQVTQQALAGASFGALPVLEGDAGVALKLAFVDIFRAIMGVCAVLCWLSIPLAWQTEARRT